MNGVRTTEFIDGDRWASLPPAEQENHRAAWADAMSDPTFAYSLAQGLDDIAAGRVHKWSDVKKELAMTEPRDPELDDSPKSEPAPTGPEDPQPEAESDDDGSTQPQETQP